MNNIKVLFTDYKDVVQAFGEEKIIARFEFFINFIKKVGDEDNDKLGVNDKVLQYCIMDYFSDVYRLKEFHKIGKINDIKRVAYESYWILRRKPIQILSDEQNAENLIFSNEKFVLTYLTNELLGDKKNNILSDEATASYKSFVNSLYYHLKYRDCDAKVLELMILSFKAGLCYSLNE